MKETGTSSHETHYYDAFTFTPPEARHAQEVVRNLVLKRRFYPHEKDTDRVLDPHVFAEILEIHRKHKGLYERATASALQTINDGEAELGFDPVQAGLKRPSVQCTKHSGGFRLCRVYPFRVFADFIPGRQKDIEEDVLRSLMGTKSANDIAPNEMYRMRLGAKGLARTISNELDVLMANRNTVATCVVFLESRVDCSSRAANGDFAHNRVSDLVTAPHALGYLVWKFSQVTRIVLHNHVVFSTSCDGHVRMEHWSDDGSPTMRQPTISFDKSGGYDCAVIFAAAL